MGDFFTLNSKAPVHFAIFGRTGNKILFAEAFGN